MSSIVNKVKDALHHDKSSETTQGSHGPHSSKVANTADPRVDSDRDHRAAGGNTYGATGTTGTSGYTGTTGTTGATSGYTGTTGTTGATSGYGTGPAPHTAGPHKSDMLNKANPTVDSDLDGSRNMGLNKGTAGVGTTGASHGTAGQYGSSGLTGTGHHGTTGTSGLPGTGHHGTTGMSAGGIGSHQAGGGYGSHQSGGALGSHQPGVTGYNDPEGTHGPHGNRMMNAADPRVDSDRDHRGTHHTSAMGTGPAQNTAGPHKSDALNKVDPRVDSDLDGSKTYGGNKTFQSSTNTNTTAHRDPTDASQVPPSVLRQHVGDVTIAHGDQLHNRERRNSKTTHQETFSGI